MTLFPRGTKFRGGISGSRPARAASFFSHERFSPADPGDPCHRAIVHLKMKDPIIF